MMVPKLSRETNAQLIHSSARFPNIIAHLLHSRQQHLPHLKVCPIRSLLRVSLENRRHHTQYFATCAIHHPPILLQKKQSEGANWI